MAIKLAVLSIMIMMELISLSLVGLAAPVVVDFEDLSTTGPGTGNQVTVFYQYAEKGISFNRPTALDYSKGDRPDIYQGFAHSGTKAIEQCYSKEFCSVPTKINFTSAQKRVKVWVGYSGVLPEPITVKLRAFDQKGAQVGQTTAILQASTIPLPIQTPMEIKSGSENIYSVTVTNEYKNGLSFSSGLAIDDIEYDKPGPEQPCSSTREPIIAITEPANGQILRDQYFNLRGTVIANAPIEEASLIITGPSGNSRSLDFFSNGVFPRDGGGIFSINGAGHLFIGSNIITVRARDCKGSGESSITLNFQPCDSTISPVVTIIEPPPSSSLNPYKTIVNKTFQLKGKIDSISGISRVTVTVFGPGYDFNEFDINPDDKGAFDAEINSDYLFEHISTIEVNAENMEGCLGQASTSVGYKKPLSGGSPWYPGVGTSQGHNQPGSDKPGTGEESYSYTCKPLAGGVEFTVKGEGLTPKAKVWIQPKFSGIFTAFGQTKICGGDTMGIPPNGFGPFQAEGTGKFEVTVQVLYGCQPGCSLKLQVRTLDNWIDVVGPSCGCSAVMPEACKEGKTSCNGICVDTQKDSNNCGDCGIKCTTGKSCDGGACK